ncbi:Isy1-like splicing family-domain-containing protein [Mycena vulgaris]|nr:Isy1-like splicing family-domain-containing protein [Mycena vulgaris]
MSLRGLVQRPGGRRCSRRDRGWQKRFKRGGFDGWHDSGGSRVGVTQALNVENDGATGRWRRVVEWRADEEVLNRGSADGIKARSLNCGIPMDLWRVNTDRGARTAPRERREGSRRGRSGRSGKPDPPKLGHPEIHCSAQLSKRDRRDGGEEYIKTVFRPGGKGTQGRKVKNCSKLVWFASCTILLHIHPQACNQEKVQSMLCRLREAQAAELGLATRADTRPRMASPCTSLHAARTLARGAAPRDQPQGREDLRRADKETAGLIDYEVRDLNDEINTQLREKRHWEMQIVAPGGANYRRNVAMRDDDGRDVRGTKGYKYFGRAKALPGVHELSQNCNQDEDEHAPYAKLATQPAEYFGNADEGDGAPRLSEYERKAEDEDADADMPSKSDAENAGQALCTAAAYLSFLSAEMLRPPPLPTAREVVGVLLALRMKALVEEYFGGEEEGLGKSAAPAAALPRIDAAVAVLLPRSV